MASGASSKLARGDVHRGADEGGEIAGGVEDRAADAGDVLERAVGKNEAELVFEFVFVANGLVDGFFEPLAVVGVNSAPEEGRRGLIVFGIGAENEKMFARPFKFAGDEIPHPTAGVAELLPFFQEKLAGALLFVAESIVDGEGDLIGDEREVTHFIGRIGIVVTRTEGEGAKAAVGCGERENACGLKTEVSIEIHHAREAGFRLRGRDENGLLVIVNPPSDGFLGAEVRGDLESRPLHSILFVAGS